MVAPNIKVPPLQHHLKDSNASTSLRHYSRVQSEMQREGFELHKEKLLSLPSSRNGRHSGEGENTDAIAPSGSQIGLPSVQSASGKARLSSVMSAGFQSVVPGEQAINAYTLYPEMFPQACTAVSMHTPAFAAHEEQELCPSEPLIAEHVEVVQCRPDVRSVEGGQEDNRKRLKYTPIREGTSTRLFQQENTSCCVVEGSCVNATRDGVRQAGMNDAGSFDRAHKSNNCAVTNHTSQHSSTGFNADLSIHMSRISSINVYSACGTSTAELPKALSAVGLKLFTTSAHAQMPKALLTFSEGEPSLPLSLERSQCQASNRVHRTSTPMHDNSFSDADWGKFLALSATPVANNTERARTRMLPLQQRFKQLQAFLKSRDETDQNECMQALRSLSSAARSGHAVELETRAIRLSLEEGKEIKRMKLLNVLGKISAQSLDDAGATPHGPRLPAPGATAKLRSVP